MTPDSPQWVQALSNQIHFCYYQVLEKSSKSPENTNIFIPRSPGSSLPCSCPWEPSDGENSGYTVLERYHAVGSWKTSSPSPPSSKQRNPASAKRIIFNLEARCVLRRTACQGPRQVLYPLTPEHSAHWIQSQGQTTCCSPTVFPLHFENLIPGFILKTPPRAPGPFPKVFLQGTSLLPYQFCWGVGRWVGEWVHLSVNILKTTELYVSMFNLYVFFFF